MCNLNVLFENDEEQHKHRTTNCDRAKISGTLVDLGAPGLTKEKAKLWSPDLPGDIALAKMDDSDLIVSDLKRDRTAAIERVTSDCGDSQCSHVL